MSNAEDTHRREPPEHDDRATLDPAVTAPAEVDPAPGASPTRPASPDPWPWRLRTVGWLGAAALAIGIFLESGSPDAGGMLANLPAGSDKIAHGLSYALLSAFLTLGSGRPLLAVVVSGVYGLSDEFHQSFVPGRSSDLLDVVADVLGSILGAYAVVFLRRRLSRRRIE